MHMPMHSPAECATCRAYVAMYPEGYGVWIGGERHAVRLEVLRFALLMEATLRANDRKGGWKSCTPSWLLRRLKAEVGELHRASVKRLPQADVEREAADVANFAMMIADNLADIPRKEPPK